MHIVDCRMLKTNIFIHITGRFRPSHFGNSNDNNNNTCDLKVKINIACAMLDMNARKFIKKVVRWMFLARSRF